MVDNDIDKLNKNLDNIKKIPNGAEKLGQSI